MTRKYLTAILVLTLGVGLIGPSGADAGSIKKVDRTDETVDRHGTCREVSRSSGWPSSMVPTRHPGEWNVGSASFLARGRPGTYVRSCGCRLPATLEWRNCRYEEVIETSGSGDSRREKKVTKWICRTCSASINYRRDRKSTRLNSSHYS